uniref:ATP synthase F0 subunit 8 n=1 Tax=Trioza urticae TaxID=121826 RepID=A0A344A2X4_TRIUR|nr:ATP synthase F0 subunit 8 [Trioza urticae]AWU49115.1 ATP synthase F0 subunit 8 [Trioza urticae]
MPQMAPMPWILILFLSLFTLLYISSYIFFYIQQQQTTSPQYKKKHFY